MFIKSKLLNLNWMNMIWCMITIVTLYYFISLTNHVPKHSNVSPENLNSPSCKNHLILFFLKKIYKEKNPTRTHYFIKLIREPNSNFKSIGGNFQIRAIHQFATNPFKLEITFPENMSKPIDPLFIHEDRKTSKLNDPFFQRSYIICISSNGIYSLHYQIF